MIRFFLSFLGGIFSMLTLGLVLAGISLGGVIYMYGRDLPTYETLAEYTPKTISRIYSGEGQIIDEFAIERRLFTPAEEIPDIVKQAFISAEDKNFYTHNGFDARGMLAAFVRGRALARARPARRLDHHPAGDEELPARRFAQRRAQDQGDHPRGAHRAGDGQGTDPRAVSQRDLSGPELLWRHRRGADLFQQAAVRPDPRRGRLPGLAAQVALQPASGARPRRGDLLAQQHAARDVRERLYRPGDARPRARRRRC